MFVDTGGYKHAHIIYFHINHYAYVHSSFYVQPTHFYFVPCD